MKRLILAVTLVGGLIMGFGGIAFAEGGHGKGYGGEKMLQKLDGMSEQERLEYLENKLDKRVAHMTENLSLTQTQQLQVRQILADAQTQMLEIYEQNKDVEDKTSARGEAKVVHKQARQDIHDLLTDDQKAKMQAHRGERHDKMKGKMVDRLDTKLDLSETQRAQVEKILAENHAKMKALRADSSDEKATRAGAVELRKEAADKINGVLDKEQQVEWAKMRESFQERAGKRGKHGKHGKRGEGKGKQRGAF